jgi:hypothetical protein
MLMRQTDSKIHLFFVTPFAPTLRLVVGYADE